VNARDETKAAVELHQQAKQLQERHVLEHGEDSA
jgi:hypothetical protein